MMQLRMAVLGALVTASACQAIDEAPAWSANYNARYDVLAHCLAGLYAANQRFYPSERRIDVVVPNSSTREAEGEFQISQVTDVV
jgi:hypothetical protein